MEKISKDAENAYKKGFEIRKTRPVEALKHFQASLEINPDHKKALLEAGIIELNLGKHEKATDLLEKSIKIHEKDGERKECAELHMLIAISNWNNGKVDLAKEGFLKSKKIFEDIDKTQTLVYADIIANIATIFNENYDLDDALGYYRQGKELYKSLNLAHTKRYAAILIGIASIYEEKKEYDFALEYYRVAKAIYNGAAPNYISPKYAFLLHHMGEIFRKSGNDATALKYLNEAYEVFQKLNITGTVKIIEQSINELHKKLGIHRG